MKKIPKRTAAVRPCKAVKRMMREADKEHVIWISLNSLLQFFQTPLCFSLYLQLADKETQMGRPSQPFLTFVLPEGLIKELSQNPNTSHTSKFPCSKANSIRLSLINLSLVGTLSSIQSVGYACGWQLGVCKKARAFTHIWDFVFDSRALLCFACSVQLVYTQVSISSSSLAVGFGKRSFWDVLCWWVPASVLESKLTAILIMVIKF